MQDFRRLKVWQKAHEFALTVYELTRGFPRDELYGLTSQMRRAAVSVPANIAEGCCRQGDVEFARFVRIALGSANELEYYLLLACDLGLVNKAEYERLNDGANEVKRMLISLGRTLKNASGTE